MPSPNCLQNIAKEPPPYNIPCTPAGCQKVFEGIKAHCEGQKLADGTPVISYDDNLYGPGKGGICYCCCSCLSYGTLIERAPGDFVPAEKVIKGTSILAAGMSLQWAPRQVTADVGFVINGTADFLHTVRYEWPQEASGFRDLIVTQDHLFLRADGKLIAAQDIQGGEMLRRADGGEARVILRTGGSQASAVHTIELGEFKDNNLDGHLMNTFGLVTTDYSVQAAYAQGQPMAELMVTDSDVGVMTTAQQRASGDADALTAFLDDPSAWPEGFVPSGGGSLINIPKNARSFFTAAQAEILLTNLEFDSPNNMVAASMVQYLFDIASASAFYPALKYILDWDNDLPNAYAFRKRDQTFLVITGGLARIKILNRNGVGLVLASMIAHTQGHYCVGEADYHATADVLRLMWNAELFANTYITSVQQMEEVFSYLPDSGTVTDRCREPSTSCRISAYRAGFMLAPVPDCAKGPRDPFGLRSAQSSDDLYTVTLTFTEAVEEISGTRKANYKITPGARVISAAIDRLDETVVNLGVTGLEPGTQYQVKVSNVMSATDQPIAKDADSATFTTPDEPVAQS